MELGNSKIYLGVCVETKLTKRQLKSLVRTVVKEFEVHARAYAEHHTEDATHWSIYSMAAGSGLSHTTIRRI